MQSDKRAERRKQLKETLFIPLDDIYNASCKVAKDWNNPSQISVKVIGQFINIAIDNAYKMKGVKDIRDMFVALLTTLKTMINKKAESMGTATIPKTLFKAYMDKIKDKIEEGMENTARKSN